MRRRLYTRKLGCEHEGLSARGYSRPSEWPRRVGDLIKWKERHLDFYALERVGVTRRIISTAFYRDQSDLCSIVRLILQIGAYRSLRLAKLSDWTAIGHCIYTSLIERLDKNV